MAVDYKDYYQILGVAKTATDKEIKAAYRKLARQLPPGRQPRRQDGRGQVQGRGGGLRGPLRCRQARQVRSVRGPVEGLQPGRRAGPRQAGGAYTGNFDFGGGGHGRLPVVPVRRRGGRWNSGRLRRIQPRRAARGGRAAARTSSIPSRSAWRKRTRAPSKTFHGEPAADVRHVRRLGRGLRWARASPARCAPGRAR